tara:strand:+ start:102 stop:416 length:315 start_codon:yes stop_codon:yes gene_type:complete
LVVVQVVVEPTVHLQMVVLVILVVLVVVMEDMAPLDKIKQMTQDIHILDRAIVFPHQVVVGVVEVMVVTVHVAVEVVEHLMHHLANPLPVRHQKLKSPPVHIRE